MSRAGLEGPRGLSRTLTVTLRYQGVAVPLSPEPYLVQSADSGALRWELEPPVSRVLPGEHVVM